MFLLAVAIILGAYYILKKYERRNWPPGPFPYPVIGNILEALRADPESHYVGFQKLAEKYGSIFSIKVGVVNAVVVNGYKALREVQCSGSVNNRQDEKWMLDRCHGTGLYGLFFSKDSSWRDNRRYTLVTLKDYGFGKAKSMDELLLEEFQVLTESLKKTIKENNGILHIEMTFNAAFVNIIYSFLTGSRFDQHDPKLKELVRLSNDYFSSVSIGGGALGFYPFLAQWAPEWSGFARNHRSNVLMGKYFQELVNEVKLKGTYKTNPANFIETFLKRIDQGAKHDDYDEPIFTEKNLVCLLNDLFAAGSETSANSTAFAVRRLVQEPEVQAKIQAEIERVVGLDRWVTLADKPQLKYTEATMLEVLRADTVVPVAPRQAHATCKFANFEIPKGTNVIPNNYSGNMDKTVWDDPEIFRPERFIDSNGDIINAEKLASFGFGKRDCIGVNVAKSTLFMAIATFAQHFTFQVDPATGMPGNKSTLTMTTTPLPFNTLVKIRV